MRSKLQSMGLWLNETNVFNPEKLDAAVHDLARSGYGIIRTMLRNTNFSHRSPVVVDAVSRVVKSAHALGLQVAIDCEPHSEPVAHDMGNLFPDAIGVRIVHAEAIVVNGKFKLHIPMPRTGGTRADFLGLEGAWLRAGGQIRKIEGFDYDHRVVMEPYSNGFTKNDHTFTPGCPASLNRYVHISGKLPGSVQGRVVVYARFFDSRIVDFWSEGVRRYYDELLECYKGIPLDGVGWDEPAINGNWQSYLWGEATAAAFEKLHGYNLADRWALLEQKAYSAEYVRTRLDYYHILNEGVFDAQRHLFGKARRLFGDDLLLGTHHTWQGEGNANDYRAGAVDYFRLNDNMDAGYTDCWWWDQKSVSYAYTLGSSLGRLTPSGEAEINTWDAKPTNARVEFQTRLMTLLDLTWFNIWYGESSDTCVYPADYTWAATVREMNQHRNHVKLINGAKPVADVAILHGWETVCGINRADIAAAHKGFCLNTAALFLDESVAFDWIDTRLLADSQIQNGRLVNVLGDYSVLIMPYATVLPRKAWKKCLEFANAGGKVVFTGTPPECDTEGNPLSAEFARLMDMPELTVARYLSEIDAVCTLPSNRPEALDVFVEMEADRQRLLTSIEGERHGVRNQAGNVLYLSDLDPRSKLLKVIEPWLQTEVVCHSNTILWRLYRDGERELLICIARECRQLRGVISWGDEKVEFRSGTIAFVERENGKIKVSAGDADYQILSGSARRVLHLPVGLVAKEL